jgi:hypothetical protein
MQGSSHGGQGGREGTQVDQNFFFHGDKKHKSGRKPMINKSTFALFAATAAVSLTSGAFAQSADRYGSTLPYYYDSGGGQVWGSWGPQQQGSANGRQSQAATGGPHKVVRVRGHSAFAYAPARHSSSRR